jgi:hypothetical protein
MILNVIFRRLQMNRFASALTLALIAGSSLAAPMALAQNAPAPKNQAQPDARIAVKTADDLPRHTYNIEGKAMDIIRNDAIFKPLLDQALNDALSDLQKYDIQDSATLRGYYDFLVQAYAAKDDLQNALVYTEKARDLEVKDQEKLMRGVALRARIAARKVNADEASPQFAEAYKAELRKVVSALPFEPIKDRLIAITNQAKIVSVQLVENSTSASMDPLIESNKGKVPQEIVIGLITTRVALDFGLRAIPLMAEVYSEIIAANANAKTAADLWTPRLVSLETSAKATPVVIGIWDSGVDTSLFPNNLWTNTGEQPNGKDDDNNGFIDDLHGIAFGLKRERVVGPLTDLSGLKGNKDQLVSFIAASQDMQAGIQNAGVDAFQNHYKNLKQDQMTDFTDDLSLLGSWSHGTHVAGIAVAGNPFARLVHITENWPYKSIPDAAPTIEDGVKWGQTCKDAVAYLKKANVRVVNMSWRVGRSAFEGMLASKGVGATPEERAELSRKIFAGLRSGLEEAIKSAPEILFIAGSGNEDNDVDFAEYVPAGLRLPNLLTVGAIDDHDKFTTFTTTGKNVELYSNGYRIESVIPGGQKIKFSGTSMAAPQVTNLAAKILALKPELKPAQVIDLIRANTDPVPDQQGRFIINPKKTIGTILK